MNRFAHLDSIPAQSLAVAQTSFELCINLFEDTYIADLNGWHHIVLFYKSHRSISRPSARAWNMHRKLAKDLRAAPIRGSFVDNMRPCVKLLGDAVEQIFSEILDGSFDPEQIRRIGCDPRPIYWAEYNLSGFATDDAVPSIMRVC